MMNRITCLSNNLNKFFNKRADEVSIETGFIKRKRKLSGSSFIKAIIFGNIGIENCSIDAMCQLLNEESVVITKQGLDFRFTKEAVEFMKKCIMNLWFYLTIPCKLIAEYCSNSKASSYWIVAILAYLTVWKTCIKGMALVTVVMKVILGLE